MPPLDFTLGIVVGAPLGFIAGFYAAVNTYIIGREQDDIKRIESMIDWVDVKSEVNKE